MKIGRDARNGQFIPVNVAKRRKATAIVESIKRPAPSKPAPQRKK